ncbi:MAG TPA: Ig-like domain-containing protein [Longimicrobium sp.]|nr:Ig-like domain-containing protein [Longimicrobium sp.]
MTRILSHPILAAAALLALAACESSTGTEAHAPARLDVVSGDLQSGTAGAELPTPIVVKVVDDKGKAVKGQLVNFRVAAGGGSVFAGSALTNKDGIAQERWTLGTSAADSQKVEARAVDPETGEGLVFAVFRATATPGAATTIAAVAPLAKSGFAGAVVADSPAVKATDKYGNPVPNVTIAWTADAGSTIGATSQTNAAGIAKAAWTLATRVDSSYRATASAGALGSAQFTATAAVPAGSILQKISGDQTVSVGTAFAPLVVKLTLADGRPVRGAEVVFSAPNAGPETVRTAADGTASYQLLGGENSPATYSFTAAVGGASVGFTAQRQAGTVARLLLVSQFDFGSVNTVLAGMTLPSFYGVVVALDAFGNPVPGAVVNYTVTQGNGSVSPAQATTNAQGRTAGAVFTMGTVAWALNEFTMTSGTASVKQIATPSTGAAGTAVVSPDTIVLAVGGEASVSGVASDVYGNSISPTEVRGDRWTFVSQNEAIATTAPILTPGQASTLVRGVAPGTTTVVGSFGHRGGTASDTVVVIVQ